MSNRYSAEQVRESEVLANKIRYILADWEIARLLKYPELVLEKLRDPLEDLM